MEEIKSYRDLLVWQKGITLVKLVYKITNQFPPKEIYSLASQMQRAAVSVPSNIAEGQQRKNLKEYLQFLRIALGSIAELETQLIIARDLYSAINYADCDLQIIELQRMLSVLIQKLENLRN